jgi:hypothetical protein
MAQHTDTIPANTTVKFARKGTQEYCLMPLGNTVHYTPVTPNPDTIYTTTYPDEMEITYDDGTQLTDAQGQSFLLFVGARKKRH